MAGLFFRAGLVLLGVALALVTLSRQVDGDRGNPTNGAVLYYGGRLACTACHQNQDSFAAPPISDIARRVATVRLPVIDDSEQTVALYLAESIIDPNRYAVPGYSPDNMPHYAVFTSGFGISRQDLKDLVAFLMTL